MSLTPGDRVGPYEVIAQIGVGGMGEVYRATDTNLKRQVAIKVLPASVAADAERLVRFQREAEVLAALNHPNIAQIHGLEKSAGVTALVMELVEGPTLADRLVHGAIPLDEALPIAKQIADALEAAHEQGIIHRDLKPANIKLRPDGMVKVLDFGIAKVIEPAGVSASVSLSPTVTPAAQTDAGMILGTAAYMSPEQARGHAVDKRSDIWAFGAVLYEMLTGRRAFGGDQVADVLASVLARDPDWTMLPAALSPVMVTYIKRCLHKDRNQRIRDIGDVSLALAGAFETSAHATAPRHTSQAAWRRGLPVAMTVLVAVVLSGLAAWAVWPAPAAAPGATRFHYEPPVGQQFQPAQRPIVSISPDERYFVFRARDGLYVRRMGDLEATHIRGTEEPLASPFVSPDGQWVGYFAASGQLKKIAVSGGTSVILCEADFPLGASWAADNTILFGQREGIMRVPADGGTPELLVRAADGEQMYGAQLLPGGDSVLFSVTRNQGPARWDQADVVVQLLSSGKRTVVVRGGSDAHYLSTGHIVYALRDGVFGVAFDAKRLTVSGGAVSLAQGVLRPTGVNSAGSNYAVSDNGTLLYLAASESRRSLAWIHRNGTAEPIKSIPPGDYEEPRLSPDDSRVLVTRDGDIWMYELAAGRSTRLTADGVSLLGVWNPTGSQVAYSSARNGNEEVWVASSDGSGQPRQLTRLGGQVHVDAWSPDGQTITVHHHREGRPANIVTVSIDDADRQPRVFLERGFNDVGVRFSRDGRHVTYNSSQTGQWEVYIRPFPEQSSQTAVSVGGGTEPVWARNGDIFYRDLTRERMFAVTVTTGQSVTVGAPVQLFQAPYFTATSGAPTPQYDVSADGQRLLMLIDSVAAPPRIVVVQHWTEELKRLVPVP